MDKKLFNNENIQEYQFKLEYNIDKFNFKELILNMFSELNFENNLEIPNVDTDQDTKYHKLFYESIHKDKSFLDLYNLFIEQEISKYFEDSFCYQTIPTFRIQLINNLSVGDYHKDSDYNHSIYEINFFIPITKCYGNNTIHLESKINKGDFKPIDMDFGEMFIFDGANLTHGNNINDTKDVRISFDFRCLKYSDYLKLDKDIKKSVTFKKEFKIGDYWSFYKK